MPFYQSPGFLNSAIFLALLIGSGLIGHWLAKALRVAEYGFKFSIILFAILASVVVVLRGWPPKLGVDLGGGSILVYKVDEQRRVWRPEMMDDLLTSIGKRVNPGGQKEISVRSLGTDMVQIVMPSVSGSTAKEKQVEADEIRKIIRTTGALEFRIVASKRDNVELIDRAKLERQKYPVDPPRTVRIFDPKRIDSKTNKPVELAKWCRVRDKEVDKVRGDDGAMMVGKHMVKDDHGKESEKEAWEVLVLSPDADADVTGEDVHDARVMNDNETGLPEVSFSFSTAGGAKFGRLTGRHLPQPSFKYHLAIVLDDELITDPVINSIITDNGRITSDNFTIPEVTEIVGYINAGSLPAALEATPVRDMTTDATLGKDTIQQSTRAMYISSIAVPLFMIFYYRFAGVVAVLVLGLNMLMLVALMILIKAPFTLPALAGLALTVGMAVDNNVLIYERLREELAHGAALRMAIRNSFHRVGVVIIDANITHLIAATVLWSVGTEQVKGFAVTFWLGAVLSIWATMFVARVLFEVSERRRWLKKMKMMQWIGHTKIDFMAWFPACATFSVVITVLGIVVAVVRGQGLFDIDFTGGVSVQTVFQNDQKIDSIREQIDSIAKELPDATVTPAKSQDEPDNTRFIVDTSNSKGDDVEKLLKDLFGEKLVFLELTAKPTQEKPAVKTEEKKPEKPAVPAAVKPAEKALETTPADKTTKPSDAKPSASKPAESKPADTKPAETKPADKPADAKPVDKPADAKPVDKPVDTKPVDAKPVDKPADAKPTDAKPADTKAKQSSSELPALSLVAMAGPEAFLLAQADSTPAKGTADLKVEVKPEVKADVKSPAKADAKPEVKADAKTDVKADAKTDVKPEAKADANTPAKTDAKPAVKTDANTPAKAETKPDVKAEAKPEAKPQSKEAVEKTLTSATNAASTGASSASGKPSPAISEEVFQATLNLTSTVPKIKDDQVVKEEQPVRYDEDRLKKLLEQVLEKEKYDRVRIELTAPDGSGATKSESWNLKLAQSSNAKNPLTQKKFETVLATLQSSVRTVPYFPIVDNIGSAVANDTRFWAVVALVSSWSLIILYLWIRFQGVAFGLAAVIALIHDVLVMLGAIAFSSYLAQIPGLSVITLIEPFKINLPIVAAFLTIIGYSVNDTIVVFDRIREIRGKSPTLTRQMVNDATNQTLSRTVLTSLTVMMVVFILYVFGGQAVHGFAFALIIGVLTGTYSSIYVAAPILLWLLHPKEMSVATSSDKPVGSR